MTHSLHRDGSDASLQDDYVMLVLTSFDRMNDPEVKASMREVWDILAAHEGDLTNFGTIRGGGRHRRSIGDFREQGGFMIHAVFKDREALRTCLEEIKERDFGLSVTISGSFDGVKRTCREISLTPHTVQCSLGTIGKTELLPDEKTLEITTMCGHAMVSPKLLAHLLEKVRKGRMTHGEAALELSRQCECGIFNPARAERLLRKMV